MQHDFAFVSLLYGSSQEYLCGILALGGSLVKSCGECHRVLLHTGDVPDSHKQLASNLWELRQVEYIWAASDLFVTRTRFKAVFTKLHVFNPKALPVKRVVFMDGDTLMSRLSRADLERLQCIPSPAAMFTQKPMSRSQEGHVGHGLINCGVMVVEPDRATFESMVHDVSHRRPRHRKSPTPEQAYLCTHMYWHSLPIQFHLEPTIGAGVPWHSDDWQQLPWYEVRMCHFSCGSKPWKSNPSDLCNWEWKHSNNWQEFNNFFENLLKNHDCYTRLQRRAEELCLQWHSTFAATVMVILCKLAMASSPVKRHWFALHVLGYRRVGPWELLCIGILPPSVYLAATRGK